jgi:hypothetical protein
MWRPHLPSNRITGNSRKVIVPQPLYSLLASFHATPSFAIGNELAALFWLMLLVPFDPAGPYQEYVTREKLDVTVSDHRLQIRNSNRLLRHWRIFDAVLLGVRYIVQQNTTTDDATSFGVISNLSADTSQNELATHNQSQDDLLLIHHHDTIHYSKNPSCYRPNVLHVVSYIPFLNEKPYPYAAHPTDFPSAYSP